MILVSAAVDFARVDFNAYSSVMSFIIGIVFGDKLLSLLRSFYNDESNLLNCGWFGKCLMVGNKDFVAAFRTSSSAFTSVLVVAGSVVGKSLIVNFDFVVRIYFNLSNVECCIFYLGCDSSVSVYDITASTVCGDNGKSVASSVCVDVLWMGVIVLLFVKLLKWLSVSMYSKCMYMFLS